MRSNERRACEKGCFEDWEAKDRRSRSEVRIRVEWQTAGRGEEAKEWLRRGFWEVAMWIGWVGRS